MAMIMDLIPHVNENERIIGLLQDGDGSGLDFNLDFAERFLSILAGDEPVTFQTFDDKKDRKDSSLATILHGTLIEHLPEMQAINRQGAGIYVMVNKGDLKGRKKENVTDVRAAFLDLDGAPLDLVLAAPLTPHLIVESSPGRYQVYWKITGLPLEHFAAVQTALATKFGGDPAVKDLPRVMRVPGFFHNKSEPVLVRLMEASDADAYPAEEFLESFDIDVRQDIPALANGDRRGIQHPRVLRLYKDYRHTTLLTIAGFFRNRGLEGEELSTALQALNEAMLTPPLDADEVSTLATDVAKRYPPGLLPSNRTELGLAEEFARRYGYVLRYCDELGGWQIWDNTRWVRDYTFEATRLTKEMMGVLLQQAIEAQGDDSKVAHVKFLKSSERKARLDAILSLSKCELPARPHDFDSDTLLLNLPNGTLDLRSGSLEPHKPYDYITKMAGVPYDANAECPTWLEFLDRIFAGDAELIAYLQRALGYSLTGDISEQCWFLLYGTGANGKSTLVNTIQYVMGEYAVQTPADTFLKHFGEGVRNDLARLRGARLIAAAEPDPSKRLDESLLKSFTGGDRVTARFLRKEYFEYVPSGKLFLAANHLPSVRDVGKGFWRRVRLIPFNVTIPPSEQDRQLEAKLRAEAPGILRWGVDGCLVWQGEGLRPPKSVLLATRDYRDEMDELQDFLADAHVIVRDGAFVGKSDLYKHYAVEYCEKRGLKALNVREFNRLMAAKGFETKQKTSERRRCWMGIGLQTDTA